MMKPDTYLFQLRVERAENEKEMLEACFSELSKLGYNSNGSQSYWDKVREYQAPAAD